MIRPGAASDLPAITVVRTAVRENHLSVEQMASVGITPMSVAARMATGELGCWVAEDGGNIIGFAMADRAQGEVFALFVHPEHEGKGHGSALLDACESWLRKAGHPSATLSTGVGTRAYGFYLRRGWKPTGEKAGHFASDDVLAKALSQP